MCVRRRKIWVLHLCGSGRRANNLADLHSLSFHQAAYGVDVAEKRSEVSPILALVQENDSWAK
jgi:hypothetical protein